MQCLANYDSLPSITEEAAKARSLNLGIPHGLVRCFWPEYFSSLTYLRSLFCTSMNGLG